MATKRRTVTGIVLAGIAGAAGVAATADAAELLPDLRPEAVSRYAFDARTVPGRVLFRFSSAISNAGAGDLVVTGARGSVNESTMVASQQISQSGGGAVGIPLPARWTFDAATGHGHWHLSSFARYELRRLSPSPTVLGGAKVGFCPRDDKPSPGTVPAAGAVPRYTANCAGPDALSLVSGIQVGFADLYEAESADQWVDVTRLRAGRYALGVTADPDGMLRESDEANNQSVRALRLPLMTPPLSRQRSGARDQAVRLNGRRAATVAFVTSSHRGTATVRVLRRGRSVDTFTQRVPAGLGRIRWDGRLANGQVARPGAYRLRITLTAARGTSPRLWVRFSVRGR